MTAVCINQCANRTACDLSGKTGGPRTNLPAWLLRDVTVLRADLLGFLGQDISTRGLQPSQARIKGAC